MRVCDKFYHRLIIWISGLNHDFWQTIDTLKVIGNLTLYPDINDLLTLLSKSLQEIFENQLVGLYLTGSLTYGDFDRSSSDIDFLAVLKRPLSKIQVERLRNMHTHIGERYPIWAQRIEGSYITKDMLSNIEPPKIPRPYINGGKLYDAPYGNEWLLNLHVLYECGVTLVGPEPKKLIGPVDINLVREASKRDLYEEWEPKLNNFLDLEDGHFQAYLILTLCRILHIEKNDEVASKKAAAAWVKKTYPMWNNLIEKAENWQYGQEMTALEETLNLLRFTLKEVG